MARFGKNMRKIRNEKVTSKFKKLVDRFMDGHSDVLKELVKR